ncbi:hypothetical protein KXS07_34225 [Inquilinus limosus]|uniref:calcium-binding protein n=1 Tax=Inquilinus limosus TaxID=171674 RepID=UPI003F16CA8A
MLERELDVDLLVLFCGGTDLGRHGARTGSAVLRPTDGGIAYGDPISSHHRADSVVSPHGSIALGKAINGLEIIDGDESDELLEGHLGDDEIHGRGGNDSLRGKGGDDRLNGGAGADTLNGGAGVDTVCYDDSVGGVTVDLGNGSGRGGDATGDVLISIENVIGSACNDTFVSGADANRIDGGAGTDRVDYSRSAGSVVVDLSGVPGAGGDGEGDVLVGIEEVVGSRHNDRITGDGAANWLFGDAGDDTLCGGGGVDDLFGEDGADVIAGGDQIDWIDGGEGDDALRGDDGDDRIYGNVGRDALDGGNGSDRLNGDEGADLLTGGKGQDYFDYETVSDSTLKSADRITDFSQAEGDQIVLAMIDADITEGGNQAFDFVDADDFSGKAGELRYEHRDGNTVIQGDTNGDCQADLEIVLTGTIVLTESDFLF